MDQERTPLASAIKASIPALRSAFSLSIFINLALFAVPLYSLNVFDRVLASRNLNTLFMLTLIVSMFLVLYGILEYARNGILIRAGVRLSDEVAKPVFDLALRAQLSGRPASAEQAMRDAEVLRTTLSSTTMSAIFDLPWTPVFIAVCFVFHPVLGFVALAGTIAILICALLTELITRDRLEEAGRHAAEAQRLLSGSLHSAEAIQGLGMGGAVLARWHIAYNSMLTVQVPVSERATLIAAVTKVVRLSVQVAMIGIGAWLAIDRLISPGVMMAAMIVMGRALMPVEQAVTNWRRVAGVRTAHNRLNELFTALPAAPRATRLPKPEGRLMVEHLGLRTVKGSIEILKDVNFTLEAGAALGVVGPSGSGKSSLAKVLAGISLPSWGSVRLDGASLTQWDPEQLGSIIGYMPQEIDFFTGTIAENIARLGASSLEPVIEASRLAGIHEAILKLPQGYQTPLADGEFALSGGMRQRIALARSIYGNPKLVILDEPNASLDISGERALAHALSALKANRTTVVLITHKLQLLAHVEHVLILNAGKVQCFGERERVLARFNNSQVSELRPLAGDQGAVGAFDRKLTSANAA